jgi:hypothetical protein
VPRAAAISAAAGGAGHNGTPRFAISFATMRTGQQRGAPSVDFAISDEHKRLQQRCLALAADFATRSISAHGRGT